MWTTCVAFSEEAAEEEVFRVHDDIVELLIYLGVPYDAVTTTQLPPEDKL